MLAESIMRSSSMPMPVRKAASVYVGADVVVEIVFWILYWIMMAIAFFYGSFVMGWFEGLVCFGAFGLAGGVIWFAASILSLIGLPRVFLKIPACILVFMLLTSVVPTVKFVDADHHAPGSTYFKTEQQKIDDYDNWCRSQGLHVYTVDEMRNTNKK